VTDDEIVACNFPKKPEKGVKVTSIFRRNGTDGEWYLDGSWKTNKTKNYYSLSGKVSLAEEKDLTASKIFPHLEELKMAETVAFYKERKEGTPIVKLVKPERDDMVSYVNPRSISGTDIDHTLVVPSETAVTQRAQRSNERNGEPQNTNTVILTEPQGTNAAPLPLSAVARNEKPVVEETAPEKKINPTYTATDNSLVINNSSDRKPSANSQASVKPNEVALPEKKINPTYTPVDNTVAINNDRTDKPVGNNKASVEPREIPVPQTVNKTEPGTSDVAPSPLSAVASNETYTDDMNVDLKKLRQQQTVTNSTPAPQKNIQATEKKETTNVKIEAKKEAPIVVAPIPRVKTSPAERNGAAMAINDRRTEVSQVVNFKSDSLQIALYDNGQIDGDTVSVLMNGQVIMSRQGLKATATRHTIYLEPGLEEFNIVLYAENLGTLPPNTGVMVVRDGADVYNLRFSSDFQKNTGIIFRRK
jgi:hypothetical protein